MGWKSMFFNSGHGWALTIGLLRTFLRFLVNVLGRTFWEDVVDIRGSCAFVQMRRVRNIRSRDVRDRFLWQCGGILATKPCIVADETQGVASPVHLVIAPQPIRLRHSAIRTSKDQSRSKQEPFSKFSVTKPRKLKRQEKKKCEHRYNDVVSLQPFFFFSI